jgi:group I intron endonuclease
METNTASQPPTYIYVLIDPREPDDIKRVRYIGKSDNPDKRFGVHLAKARIGVRRHCYNWIRELLAVGVLPGHEIISVVSDSGAYAAEQETIAKFKLLGAPLTNLADGGPGMFGYHHSEETRARISAANMGKKLGSHHSDETRAKMSAAKTGNKNFLGHHHSEETKRKISAAKTGNKAWLGRHHSEETRTKISAAHLGKKLSPETCAKIGAAKMGNKNLLGYHHSEETREKLSKINAGKKLSSETRGKISAASRGRVASPETRAKLRGNKNALGCHRSEETKRKMRTARRAYWVVRKNGGIWPDKMQEQS